MIDPLVLEPAATHARIRVLGFSTQGFYKWKRSPVSGRDLDDAHLCAMKDCYPTRLVGYSI